MNTIITKAILLFYFLLQASYLPAAETNVQASTAAPVNLISGPALMLNNTTDESLKKSSLPARPKKPKYVRGIHLTSWVAGSAKGRERIDKLLDETEINTVVIDIKEMQGEVYIPGVKTAEEESAYVSALPKIKEYIAGLKKRGIYTVARIVVFKDNLMPRKKPELAVKDKTGAIWQDRAGIAWLDPFNKDAWDYNIEISKRAVELGFEEIQFDYIRFPSDGNIRNCRYSKIHTSSAAAGALVNFLKRAQEQITPLGAYLSIDVFGLATTNIHDMGIGQKIIAMSEPVDFVSPMVYPSHYNKGEYGIPEPELEPYDTVYLSLKGAKKRMGESFVKLRPWLQDFSMKHRYKKEEVRAQIQAAYDNGIGDWLLWNPSCRYTVDALKTKEFSDSFEKSGLPEPKMRYAAKKSNAIKISSYTVTTSLPAVSVSSSSAVIAAPGISSNTLTGQTTSQ